MPRAQNYKKHVFCLEGDWHKDLRDRSSIKAALSFLSQNFGIKYIYKQCGTKENLEYYLNIWHRKKYSQFSICYLAFHGEPASIQVGREFVSLEELAEMLEDSCKDKIIHFGSCKTLNADPKVLENFLKKTGALCVCGFRSEIDFLESSVFDLLLIEMFQRYIDVARLKNELRKNYGPLARRLEFKIVHL